MEIGEGFLREVGLTVMEEEEKQAFLDYVKEELEVRVGEEIADGMSEEKVKEFEVAETEEEIKKWLSENKPNYREIVQRTVEELKREITKNRDKILAGK